MHLYFIRHAESYKTVADRHGGPGLPLTAQGRLDVLDLISFLENTEKMVFKDTLFYCSDLIQVRETAKIIEEQKIVSFQVLSALNNIYLGVLDGLTKDEALKKYPIEASNLEKWRAGQTKINDIVISGAETLTQFYDRVFKFISSSVLQNTNTVIIGTRSVGVAIMNIFSNFSATIDTDNYKRVLFDPSSISKYNYEFNKPKIIYLNKTDFLTAKVKYPDK